MGGLGATGLIARELMTTEVIKIRLAATVGDAVELLREHTISGLPVVDGEDRLIGVITGGDVLRAIEQRAQKIYHALIGLSQTAPDPVVWHHDRERLLDLPVEKMMSRGAVTVSPDTPVGEIADLMLGQNVRRVFVVEQHRLAGLITRNDMVRWLVSKLGESGVSSEARAKDG